MNGAILVLNAGSSSIKFSVYLVRGAALDLMLGGQTEGLYTEPKFKVRDVAGTVVAEQCWPAGSDFGHEGAVRHLSEFLREHLGSHPLLAVGHRVVHGGTDYAAPVRLSSTVVDRLARLVPLAPLHQPHNLAPIRMLLATRPELLQVACFDTAFHRTQPELAQSFALPREITERGVHRYGFHGLSYEYIAATLPSVDSQAAQGRTVVLHLGNGASMCAMAGGKSIATTLGFTAVDGLPMGTRSGTLDPGVLLYLMDEMGMNARAIEKLIYQQSGLLGVSGISSDMRTLLASSEPRARFAVELFTYRIGRELGSLAAALGGLDALVFTAGIGEHAAEVRQRVGQAAGWLGVELDESANQAGRVCISTPQSRVSAWVIPTNEELMIARHTRDLLAAHAA